MPAWSVAYMSAAETETVYMLTVCRRRVLQVCKEMRIKTAIEMPHLTSDRARNGSAPPVVRRTTANSVTIAAA